MIRVLLNAGTAAAANGITADVDVLLDAGGGGSAGDDFTVTASVDAGAATGEGFSAGLDESVALNIDGGEAIGDPSDTNFASVSLLLPMDGTNGSTTFTDASTIGHTITVGGDAQVTTTSPKYGTGALLCDGTGDFLSVPSHSSLTFGTGDFTIEAWIRIAAFGATQYIFSQRDTVGFSLLVIADGRLSGNTPNNNTITEASVTMVVDTYYHVAWTRSGTSHNLWIDGVSVATRTDSENGLSGTSFVGARNTTDNSFNGRIDDLRVTKGVARYTAAFTPPTQAFPTS